MRSASALKLTVQQRLGFEITYARARIQREYERMQIDLHSLGKYADATGIALHEAEQILAALERVNGEFYKRIIEGEKSYREEQKRQAKEDAKLAIAKAKP